MYTVKKLSKRIIYWNFIAKTAMNQIHDDPKRRIKRDRRASLLCCALSVSGVGGILLVTLNDNFPNTHQMRTERKSDERGGEKPIEIANSFIQCLRKSNQFVDWQTNFQMSLQNVCDIFAISNAHTHTQQNPSTMIKRSRCESKEMQWRK